MDSHRQPRMAFLLAFGGLMMVGGALRAGHETTAVGSVELLRSSSSSGIQRATAGVVLGTCPGPVVGDPNLVVPGKELFIIDVSVVDDCYRTTWEGDCPDTQAPATRGAWAFGRVMEGVFGTTDPKKLSNGVRQWLHLWLEDKIVNGELVESRPAMRDLVLRPWEDASRASGSSGNDLDMKLAPFRLLAIVNQQAPTPGFLNAGELRLIYNVLDASGNRTAFNVILEFKMPGASCEETLSYTHAFHALSSMPFGPDFNATLQAITDRVITLGAIPGNLNGSALNRMRTNEAFLEHPWELREFVLVREDGDSSTKNAKLEHDALDQTPAAHYQGTQVLADFITEFASGILGQQVLPISYRGEPFLAGVARNDLTLGWIGPEPICTSAQRGVRRTFSLKTCQGCHGKETATNFVHVKGRQLGQPAELSQFLTGPFYRVLDECNTVVNVFGFPVRQTAQCMMLNSSCSNPPAVATEAASNPKK